MRLTQVNASIASKKMNFVLLSEIYMRTTEKDTLTATKQTKN
mgnify:CR=1 FL=1|jgi:hypothetical protein